MTMRLSAIGSETGLDASDKLFAHPLKEGVLHQFVMSYRANGRQGTRAQKTRAEVAHSTKKLFRQKGTGRARGGMSSSPVRVGGGRAFPNRPDENFTHKINRKVFRSGMAMLLSQLVREDRLRVAGLLALPNPKTRDLAAWIRDHGVAGRVLFVDTELDGNLALAARNLPTAAALRLGCVGPTDLMYCDSVVVSERAIRAMEEMWT